MRPVDGALFSALVVEAVEAVEAGPKETVVPSTIAAPETIFGALMVSPSSVI